MTEDLVAMLPSKSAMASAVCLMTLVAIATHLTGGMAADVVEASGLGTN